MIVQQHKNVTTQEQEAEVEYIADHATNGPRNNLGLQKEKSFLFQSDLNILRSDQNSDWLSTTITFNLHPCCLQLVMFHDYLKSLCESTEYCS